jgi:hypothetical protein
MRIAVSVILLLLLALTALAGNGCKRPLQGASEVAAHPQSFARMAHGMRLHPLMLAQHRQAEPSHPAFVFCHPRADQLSDDTLSAAAAQVVFDLQANNDDRTEMIAADLASPEVTALPPPQVSVPLHDRASAWQPVWLRPPRLA